MTQAVRGAGTQAGRAAVLVTLCLLLVACGKKGAPLAPLVRIPAAVTGMAASRVGVDVYLTFKVPASNVDRSTPVDIDHIDVYAFTGSTPPPRARFAELATRIARVPVARPVAAGTPSARPAAPDSQDADVAAVGADVSLRDTLTPTDLAPGTRRYYLAVPFSTRNSPGPQPAPVELPLQEVPPPPADPAVTFSATEITLTWVVPSPMPRPVAPSPGAPPATPAGASPAASPREPVDASSLPVRVNVYRNGAAPAVRAASGWRASRPVPLNRTPLEGPTFATPVVFDAEACFVLRGVVGDGATRVEGEASPPLCITPLDRFAPAAPRQLVAVPGEASISLLWEPNTESDLAGYLVLRGAPGDDRLQPLTPAPIREPRYQDATAVPGMRYVYAVVAVDTRTPSANLSPESARVEESAR